MKNPMHLICIHPLRMDCLFSDFKEQGYGSRQVLVTNEQETDMIELNAH